MSPVLNATSLSTLSAQDEYTEKLAESYMGERPTSFIGPFIVTVLLDHVLFGVFLHQLIIWACSGRQERWFIKAVVALISVATCIATAFAFYFLWDNVVLHFAQYRIWVQIDKSAWYSLIASGSTIVSQIFYTERAYKLSGRKLWIWFLVMPFCAATFGCALAAKLTGNNMEGFLKGHRVISYNLAMAATLVADLLVTGLMLWSLIRCRTGAGDKDRLIYRLLNRMTLECQLPPTIIGIACMILYTVAPASPNNAIFYASTKIYAVSLLATLNTQRKWKKNLNPVLEVPTVSGRESNFIQTPEMLDISVHQVPYGTEVLSYEHTSRSPPPKSGSRSTDVKWDSSTVP